LVSARRAGDAARRFFRRGLRILKVTPVEVVVDAVPVHALVLDKLVPRLRVRAAARSLVMGVSPTLSPSVNPPVAGGRWGSANRVVYALADPHRGVASYRVVFR